MLTSLTGFKTCYKTKDWQRFGIMRTFPHTNNGTITLEDILALPQKAEDTDPLGPSNSAPRCVS